ncbi:MAG: CoA pyrophosphatase [Candidatus Heimdallarchaeota archaeon]|nr:CoA pyrophosphatase [Candidatus Heimdallarchaeota archaeon]
MLSFSVIKSALDNYHPRKLLDDGSVRGAVLVPIFEKNNSLYMLLTKRTEALSSHKGEISFPGGKKGQSDLSLVSTALRETKEEIGLNSSCIEIIGELDQIKTYGSNVLLSPFVCKIHSPFSLIINHNEVQEIIEVPLDELIRSENWSKKEVQMIDLDDKYIWYFFFKNWVIWGATAKIIRQFLAII